MLKLSPLSTQNITLNPIPQSLISKSKVFSSLTLSTIVLLQCFLLWKHILFNNFTFIITGLHIFLAKKEFEIVFGNPSLGHLNFQNYKIFKSDPTWPPITQYFHCIITKYCQNKDVCKKKNRAQNIEIWPNGGYFCKNILFLGLFEFFGLFFFFYFC